MKRSVTAFFFLLIAPSTAILLGQSSTLPVPAKALKQMLNADGSLNLSSGFSGSLNLEGYRMVTGRNGEPRFLPVGESQMSTTAATSTDPDDMYWDNRFPFANLTDGVPYAFAVSGSDLYAGGYFTTAGDVSANHIAKWNGSSWSALGSGMAHPNNPFVSAIAVSGSDIYAGGNFTTAGGVTVNSIAKWNGSSWSALGSGVQGDDFKYLYALAVSGTSLYAGGGFTTAGGDTVNYIAKWNGTSWSALGGGMDNEVFSLAVIGTDLYAGGNFTTAGGVPANRIAKWDGTSWSALGSGMENRVEALAVIGSDLYAGGGFTTAGDVTVNSIAKWNGTSWSALGSGMNSSVLAFAVSGTDLYAGGQFTTAGGVPANYVAKWNGTSWSALGSGMAGDIYTSPFVYALAVSGTDLYAGGNFTTAGGVPVNRIAKWNGTSWSILGGGMDNEVFSLAVAGTDLYTGGNFTTAGVVPANRIVKWDGTSWSALGSGMENRVEALAVIGSDLYAGGGFTTAGGVTVNSIAKWNGTSWSALGSGMNSSVLAFAVSGTDLYAGGQFTTAGGVPANYVAKWNGTSWSALGSGMAGDIYTSPFVYALAVSGTDLYAGGTFPTAGGVTVNYIAKWNGSSWSALGSGMNSSVLAFAVIGSDLYAGGGFTTAGGVPANYVAKWNGTSWSALGSGMAHPNNPFVAALAVSGSDLYAGGNFTTAGGVTVNSIAKWNGSSWSALGSGVLVGDFKYLYALAVSGTSLYAGGGFTTAGGKPSYYIGRWFKPTSAAAVTKTFTTPTTGINFNDTTNVTGVRMAVSSSSGGGTVLVNRYEDAPQDSSSIAGSVSQYRWIIQQMGLAPSFSANIGFRVSQIPNNGISDPYSVVVYSRPTPGKGTFTALTTTYDTTFDRIIANAVLSFGEFAFGSSNNPLPVQITEFTATAEGLSAWLHWTTVSETNNYGFYVERRPKDNQTFITVSELIPGAGTSLEEHHYEWTDANTEQGTFYYRLRQVDLNGDVAYSNEITVMKISNFNSQIPNAGFEDWITVGNCIEPTSWYSFYSLFDSSGSYCPVTRSTDHYPANSGSYSVRIANDTAIFNNGTPPGNFLGWGMLLSSKLDDRPLFPVTGHPASLRGYYKFFPENGDTMNINIHLYYNSVEVASGRFQSDVAASSWTSFQVFFTDTLYANVDSARITLSASNEPKDGSHGPLGNSVLYVDNLSFDTLITSVPIVPNVLPTTFLLGQNYPNPFNPTTELRYQISEVSHVTLKVFDVLGREVATLVNGVEQPGYKSVMFDGSKLSSGLYIYRLQAEKFTTARKLLLLK